MKNVEHKGIWGRAISKHYHYNHVSTDNEYKIRPFKMNHYLRPKTNKYTVNYLYTLSGKLNKVSYWLITHELTLLGI